MKKFFVLSVVALALGACSSTPEPNDKNAEEAMTTPAETKSEKTEDKTAETSSSGSKSSCLLDKDTRVIEVKKTDAGGCELFYTKFGEAKSVASSGFGTQYCEEVKDRIQTNLNKAGFKCQ